MKQVYIINTICFLLIFLFAYTSLNKLYNHAEFYAQLNTFPFLKSFSFLISWSVPLAELITTCCLIIPKFRLLGLYASEVLLILFTIYLIVITFLENKLPCSCGGVLRYLTWKQHILFNLFFILIAALAIRLQKKFELKNYGNTEADPAS